MTIVLSIPHRQKLMDIIEHNSFHKCRTKWKILHVMWSFQMTTGIMTLLPWPWPCYLDHDNSKNIPFELISVSTHIKISTQTWSPPTWKYEFLEKFSISWHKTWNISLFLCISFIRFAICSLKAYFSYFGAPTYDFRVIKPAVDTH